MKNDIKIALQLRHPDAHFYRVVADDNNIFGFFEGAQTGISWKIPIGDFLWGAYQCSLIWDYHEHENGKFGPVWLPTGLEEGYSVEADKFIAYTIEEGGKELQDILREVFLSRLQDELKGIRYELGAKFPDDKIFPGNDSAFVAAAVSLADIVNAARQTV